MAQNPIVTIEMEDGGVMKAELYPDVAPNTVNNFISLIQKGYYDGLIFHRVIPGFMIQGRLPRRYRHGRPRLLHQGGVHRERLPEQPGPRPGRAVHGPHHGPPTPPAASSSSWWRRPPTWTASTPPSARSSRAWRWPTPSSIPSGTGTTSPASPSA